LGVDLFGKGGITVNVLRIINADFVVSPIVLEIPGEVIGRRAPIHAF
jgi:hypothetical protein